MCFNRTDNGTFYLSEEQKAEQKYDKPTGEQMTRLKTKYELLQDLKREGFRVRSLYTTNQLHAHANSLHVPFEITEDIIKPGWVGANKGLLQVLWERVFVDENRWREYSLEGKKSWRDQDGKIKEQCRSYLLRERMNNCGDFNNEKSAMEVLCDDLSSKGDNNVYLLITPKYHPEITGGRIEYVWGLMKKVYRKIKYEEKKGKEKFDKAIKKCVRQVNRGHINKFVAKYRLDMLAYTNRARQTRDGVLNSPLTASKSLLNDSNAIGTVQTQIL